VTQERALNAVVTGGSRGIGRAICLAFARSGYEISFFYIANDAAAAETVRMLRELGKEARAMRVDVRDDERVRNAFDELESCAGVDILVNCAGITSDRTLAKMTFDQWEQVLGTNLTGCFTCSRAAIPRMRERGFGRIVNISSIIGQTGNIGQANYAASKAGVLGFTKALALETAHRDITVNVVCPGFIDTEMLQAVPAEAREQILARIPKRRFGTPEEVARVVAFLAAPESGFITGQEININGGMYM
jgi:NAD(P)-dependent dehydrogenase (short-subunit alcohol dehydrogenase family)